MKSKFKFPFNTDYIMFDQVHEIKFKIEGSYSKIEGSSEVRNVSEEIEILIDPYAYIDQKNKFDGDVIISIPGDPIENEFIAFDILERLESHISFFYGDIRFFKGMVIAERIPENEKEKEEIRDKKFRGKLSLQEVPKPKKFDQNILRLLPAVNNFKNSIDLYIEAGRTKNPVDKYLNYFKVIETEFHFGKKKAKESLGSNERFREILLNDIQLKKDNGKFSPVHEDEITQLIEILVSTRDNCAHLKEKNKFGFSPKDPVSIHKLKPFIGIAKAIAFSIIHRKYKESNPQVYNHIGQ